MTSIWEQKFGRSAAYSCRTNILINYLYNLIVLRKNNRHRWDILNQWESMGFPEMCLFSCLELSYGTSIQEDSIQFLNSQMLLS